MCNASPFPLPLSVPFSSCVPAFPLGNPMSAPLALQVSTTVRLPILAVLACHLLIVGAKGVCFLRLVRDDRG